MRIKNLLVAIVLSMPFFSYALEGKGSEKDPYKVGSADDLDELSDMVNGWNGITPITKMIYVVQEICTRCRGEFFHYGFFLYLCEMHYCYVYY